MTKNNNNHNLKVNVCSAMYFSDVYLVPSKLIFSSVLSFVSSFENPRPANLIFPAVKGLTQFSLIAIIYIFDSASDNSYNVK